MRYPRYIVAALTLFTCSSTFVYAADSFIFGAPVFGAVFDSRSHSIRRIIGVLGASSLADTLVTQIDSAEIAPNGNTALAVKEGQLYAISSLQNPNPTWTPITPAPSGIDRIVWNRESTAAAIYSAASRSLTLLTNFSASGADQISIALDSLSGSLNALVLDRSGTSVVLAYSGNTPGVYLASTSNPPTRLAPLTNPTALDLIRDERNLLVADAATSQIFEIRNFRGTATLIPFANLPSGSSNPVGLSTSPDSKLLFAADQSCNCIGVYEYTSRLLVNQLSVGADPGFLKPLPSSSLFLVNTPSDSSSTFWMLSTSETPGTFFVSGGSQ